MSWLKGPVESDEFGESGKFGENLPKGLTKANELAQRPRGKRRCRESGELGENLPKALTKTSEKNK